MCLWVHSSESLSLSNFLTSPGLYLLALVLLFPCRAVPRTPTSCSSHTFRGNFLMSSPCFGLLGVYFLLHRRLIAHPLARETPSYDHLHRFGFTLYEHRPFDKTNRRAVQFSSTCGRRGRTHLSLSRYWPILSDLTSPASDRSRDERSKKFLP